jgi:L-2-hydroxyglutarate oxidase LhgO
VATSCAAASVEPGRRALGLRHADGETVARRAVFCAGPWSDRLAASHWRAGLLELRRAAGRGVLAAEAARYVPEIEASDLLPAFSGIRAQALARDGTLLDDFVVSETERAVHVRNAPSPAATSSLALARLIVDRVERLP